MAKLTEEQARDLYRLSEAQAQKWGASKPFASEWRHNCGSTLYALACKIAGVTSMSDREIYPAVFGDQGFDLLRSVALNEYWVWRIAHEYSLHASRDREPHYTLNNAISAIRCQNTRAFTPRHQVLTGELTPTTACQLTAIGCLLWNFENDIGIPNPLFFSASEWAEYKSNQPSSSVNTAVSTPAGGLQRPRSSTPKRRSGLLSGIFRRRRGSENPNLF